MAEEDINSWLIISEYRPMKIIGRGSYGIVIEAEKISTGKRVAIKRFIRIFLNVQEAKQIVREIKSLINLKHPSIIKIYDIIFVRNPVPDLYIVMPLFPFDLLNLFESNLVLPESHIKKIFHRLLSGIGYMHSAGIIHRDLKLSNVLINHECEISICDFDMSKQVYPSKIECLNHLSNSKNSSVEYCIRKNEHKNGMPSDIHHYLHKPDTIYANEGQNINKKNKINQSLNKLRLLINQNGNGPILNNIIAKNEKKELANSMKEKGKLNNSQINKLLNESKNERLNLPKILTQHVTSRYYRPPEVILLEKYYDYSLDIWSAGCIFADLLLMKLPAIKERLPIFYGKYCFPLSPASSPLVSPQEALHLDQMTKILSVIGFPDKESLSFVSDPKAHEYLARFHNLTKVDFKMIMPWISDLESDLLEKMLAFNPFHRPSASECLNHPYFFETVDCLPFFPADSKVLLGNNVDQEEDIENLKSVLMKAVDEFKAKYQLNYL